MWLSLFVLALAGLPILAQLILNQGLMAMTDAFYRSVPVSSSSV